MKTVLKNKPVKGTCISSRSWHYSQFANNHPRVRRLLSLFTVSFTSIAQWLAAGFVVLIPFKPTGVSPISVPAERTDLPEAAPLSGSGTPLRRCSSGCMRCWSRQTGIPSNGLLRTLRRGASGNSPESHRKRPESPGPKQHPRCWTPEDSRPPESRIRCITFLICRRSWSSVEWFQKSEVYSCRSIGYFQLPDVLSSLVDSFCRSF